jgi:CDP-diacylglycerol--serine O-phosphatidyltransferase
LNVDFKLKDACTAFNIALALYSVILTFEGRLELAAWLIFASWFADGLDGLVARWTKTGNEFGAHFDNQADLFIFSVAPAFYAYAVYQSYSPALGMVLCTAVITVGCIRLARFNVKALIYPGFWIGYPRPALGLFIVFLLTSRLFAAYRPYLASAALILVLTALNLSYIPFRNHKTRFNAFERWVCRAVWVSIPISIWFGWLWDGGLFYSTVYLLLPFTPLYTPFRDPVRRYVAEWKAGRA